MKDAPPQLKFCFKVTNYDNRGNYLVFETNDGRYLGFNSITNQCVSASDFL